jgi:Zn-dependent M28 family amino/carboxypeptidase
VAGKQRKHSFEFVAFAAEEKGLLGSRAYLQAMRPEEQKQITAVVTMDSLGLSPVKIVAE